MKSLAVLVAAVYLTCVGPAGAVWDHEEPDDPDYGNGGPTKLYLNEQPMISAFDVGSRMRQYNFMNYYSNTMKYHPNMNMRSMLAKSYIPVDTDGLDKYKWTNWLGEEFNPVKDNAIAYNIITNPFIKDATYEGRPIWNGVGREVDRPVMFYGPNPKRTKAMMADRYMQFRRQFY